MSSNHFTPEWVWVEPADFGRLNSSTPREQMRWQKETGVVAVGPFVVDADNPGVFMNLAFQDRGDERVVTYGDGSHQRLVQLKGRVTKRDGEIRMTSTNDGEIRVRPLALDDKGLLPKDVDWSDWASVTEMADEILEKMM